MSVLTSQLDDGFPFRGFIGERGQQAGLHKHLFINARSRMELGSLTITDSDCTGLVQQQRINVTGSLNGFTRLCNHIGTQGTIHTGNTDGRKQTADGCRYQADK